MNCVVQDGILKAAFYLPEHLRLDGNNPAYEVFLDKKAHQFLTYDHLEKKWRDAKLDRLNWPGRNYYATCWASEKDAAVVQDYLCGERGGDLGILDFQRNVRDEQLEQRHKRITGAWDQDLAQVPELPKDWMRWIDKVAVRENFIFYRYKRGGAQNGYCTFCGKEVPISGHPYHNKKGRCACCRHPIVFKALGRAGYIRTEKDYAYLIQRCKDGFVLREFWAERTYWKDSLPSGKPYWHEFRRSIYDRSGEIRSYYWGVYCQRETRWISGNPCYYSYCGNQTGRVYGKSLPCMEQKELFGTGLVQWIRTHPVTDPEKYLAVWKRMPKMEQIWKADLPRLTKECFEHCDSVRERILYPNETRLIRALGLDGPKFRRLRQINGDTEDLAWLQLEKRTNQRIPDELFRWLKKERISAKDILFIADRMSPIQIRNYLQKQNTTFERYVIAMDIPMIGNTASGVLCREFHGSLEEFRDAVYTGYDFRQLPDFGETLHNNIHEWFCNEENFCIWEELQMMMNIQKPAAANNQAVGQDTPFAGKNIVVTGKVEPYTRDEMNSLIASLGAVAGSSVSRKTDYLVCGEKAGSKLSKAQELGIRVLTPNEFFNMAGVA